MFTEDEIQRFELRWDNGYDLKHDQRYNKWLEIHHPDYLLLSKTGHLDDTDSLLLPHFSSDEAPPNTQCPPLSGRETPTTSPVLPSLLVLPEAPTKTRKKRADRAAQVLSHEELLEAQEKYELAEKRQWQKEERERRAQVREQERL